MSTTSHTNKVGLQLCDFHKNADSYVTQIRITQKCSTFDASWSEARVEMFSNDCRTCNFKADIDGGYASTVFDPTTTDQGLSNPPADSGGRPAKLKLCTYSNSPCAFITCLHSQLEDQSASSCARSSKMTP